jgi:hypothetical protein
MQAAGGTIVMAPSGVQKERMEPRDMFVLDAAGNVLHTPEARPPPYKPPKLSECAPLFTAVRGSREAVGGGGGGGGCRNGRDTTREQRTHPAAVQPAPVLLHARVDTAAANSPTPRFDAGVRAARRGRRAAQPLAQRGAGHDARPEGHRVQGHAPGDDQGVAARAKAAQRREAGGNSACTHGPHTHARARTTPPPPPTHPTACLHTCPTRRASRTTASTATAWCPSSKTRRASASSRTACGRRSPPTRRPTRCWCAATVSVGSDTGVFFGGAAGAGPAPLRCG